MQNAKLWVVVLWMLGAAAYAAEPIPAASARREVDLASDTAWTLSIDGGAARPIKVPAGGYASELQTPPIDTHDVKDFVTYQRSITIPAVNPTQVTRLEFGAVNYAFDLFLDGKQVASTTETPSVMLPSIIDLTPYVAPGKTYALAVKVYNKWRFGSATPKSFDMEIERGKAADLPPRTMKWHMWIPREDHCVDQGITRYVKLAIYPDVFLEKLFVRPSVKNAALGYLSYDVWIQNHSARPRDIVLQSDLTSWNKHPWTYPALPDQRVTLPPNSTTKVTVGPVRWGLGGKSYWWPNLPFREDYVAELHNLNLKLTENDHVTDQTKLRFGFVEYAESPDRPELKQPGYLTVNGVRFTGISDGTPEVLMANGAYSLKEGFLSGCAETWKRYMRLGINMCRPHLSIATPRMLETADEVGFMISAETTFDGQVEATALERQTKKKKSAIDDMSPATMRNTVTKFAEHYRNHPCVATYSLFNEWDAPRDMVNVILDCMLDNDPTRPLLAEGCCPVTRNGWVRYALHYGHLFGPCTRITYMGEHHFQTWDSSLAMFAASWDKWYRYYDVTYMAGWCWLNYWPNLIAGVECANHNCVIKPVASDRIDGKNGWGSPSVDFIKRCHAPYLVMDIFTEKENRDYSDDWPKVVANVLPGETLLREVELFNGGLAGSRLTLRWTLHWDTATGEVAGSGAVKDILVEPGFHVMQPIRFVVPEPGKDKRKLYLVLESVKDDAVVYTENRVYLNVGKSAMPAEAKFLGIDADTRGNWRNKYGAEGYAIIGQEIAPPAYAKIAWYGDMRVYEASPADPRALQYGGAQPLAGQKRIAAALCQRNYRTDWPVTLTVDVGNEYHNIAVYVARYDDVKAWQSFELRRTAGAVLDSQRLDEAVGGKYLLWRIRGKVTLSMDSAGCDAAVSGLFFDPSPKDNP